MLVLRRLSAKAQRSALVAKCVQCMQGELVRRVLYIVLTIAFCTAPGWPLQTESVDLEACWASARAHGGGDAGAPKQAMKQQERNVEQHDCWRACPSKRK